jgi:hypothetical protein
MRSEYKSLHGEKILAFFVNRGHPFRSFTSNINQPGATFGTSFTHAKGILVKPYATDETI